MPPVLSIVIVYSALIRLNIYLLTKQPQYRNCQHSFIFSQIHHQI